MSNYLKKFPLTLATNDMQRLESLHWFLHKPKIKTLISEFSFAKFLCWISYSYILGFPFYCWIILLLLKIMYLLLSPSICTTCVLVPMESRRGHERPRDCTYSSFEMPDISVGTEPRSSAKDVRTFNHLTTSESFCSQCFLVLQVFICYISLMKTFANV